MGFIDAITAVADPRNLDDCDEWCAGLPLESIRLLESGELALLRGEVNTQFAWQRAISISTSFVFAGLYIASILFPSPLTFLLTAGGASLMAIFIIWLFSDRGSWLRRYKALQLDLASGFVHCFCGDDPKREIEVLPRSEVVYKSSKGPARKWRRVDIVAIAKTPPIASIASDWLQPIDGRVGRFFCGKRALSSAERSEIRRWSEQVLDNRRRNTIVYLCWAAFIGWLSRSGDRDLFIAALALTGYAMTRLYSELCMVVALKRDAEEGTVVINRRATVTDGSFTPVGTPSEFLPRAKLKWTDDGAPVGWRKHPE